MHKSKLALAVDSHHVIKRKKVFIILAFKIVKENEQIFQFHILKKDGSPSDAKVYVTDAGQRNYSNLCQSSWRGLLALVLCVYALV